MNRAPRPSNGTAEVITIRPQDAEVLLWERGFGGGADSHMTITPFIRPYPVHVGDYFRVARDSGIIQGDVDWSAAEKVPIKN